MQLPLSQSLAGFSLLSKTLSLLLKVGRQFLLVIVRRLFSLWKYCAASIGFLLGNGKKGRKTSLFPQSIEGSSVERSHLEQEAQIVKDLSYTALECGEIISVDDVARSEYPFSGGSIRNISQASLQGSRLAHERNVGGSRSQTRLSLPRPAHSPSLYSLSNQSITVDIDDTAHRPSSPPRTPTRTSLASVSRASLDDADIDLSYLSADHTRKRRNNFTTPMPTISAEDVKELPRTPSAGADNIPQSPSSQRLRRRHISPAIPRATQRYAKRPLIEKHSPNITIKPLTWSYLESRTPSGWKLCEHPEGARYFYHEDKRIFTDADLFNSRILDRATNDIETIEQFIGQLDEIIPKNRHLVIDLNEVGQQDNIQTDYYFVNHDTRKVFFLDLFEADSMNEWYEARGCNSMKHLGMEMEAQYWFFVGLYPDSISLSQKLIGELRDMTHHFIGDILTSPQSISPFSSEIMEKILEWTSSMERNLKDDMPTIGTISLLARLLFSFYHSRYLHFHGEAHARLERDNSVYAHTTDNRTWLIKICSWGLFWAPYVHYQAFQKMWVDGLMHNAVWEQSMTKLTDEWQEFVLFGTVLLNANVGFLAIQSVDSGKGAKRTPAQVASYLSIVFSIGCILLGLLLVRQHKPRIKQTADDVQNYLQAKHHPLLGLEALAILHSLPYALFMWAMVALLAAFSFYFFQGTEVVTRSVVGSLGAAVATLVAWSIYHAWQGQPESNAPTHPRLTGTIKTTTSGIHELSVWVQNVFSKYIPHIHDHDMSQPTGGSALGEDTQTRSHLQGV